MARWRARGRTSYYRRLLTFLVGCAIALMIRGGGLDEMGKVEYFLGWGEKGMYVLVNVGFLLLLWGCVVCTLGNDLVKTAWECVISLWLWAARILGGDVFGAYQKLKRGACLTCHLNQSLLAALVYLFEKDLAPSVCMNKIDAIASSNLDPWPADQSLITAVRPAPPVRLSRRPSSRLMPHPEFLRGPLPPRGDDVFSSLLCKVSNADAMNVSNDINAVHSTQ